MLTNNSNEQNKDELSDSAKESIAALTGFIKGIKPVNKGNELAESSLLNTSSVQVDSGAIIKTLLQPIIAEVDFTLAFTNSGVPQGTSFTDETLNILKSNVLPFIHSRKDVRYIIREVFSGPKDFEILTALFADTENISFSFTESEKQEMLISFRVQLIKAVEMTSYRVAALGIDDDIYERAGKEEALITPFMEQNREINELLCNIEGGHVEKALEDLAQSKVMLKQCRDNIVLIDKGAEKNGASLRQTFILRKLELLISRLGKLLPLVCYEDVNTAFDELSLLIREIILEETKEKKFKDFVSRNINLIAYRITENKRKTGEHYIAADKKEYWDLFVSACGGGLIVSFLVIFKLLAHQAGLPLLWEGLVYSLIYATGFVTIQVLHFTLATKQPAMTAAYIAASLDDVRDDSSRYTHFAAMIAMVSRSQFVSFVGNLLVVFPLCLCLILLLNFCSPYPVLSAEEGKELLYAVHPGYSLSFLYASIAGIFLFVAGIISGFGDNKAVVSQIGLRIEAHPFLKKKMAKEKLSKLASYIETNLGPLTGNIALGFFLGMSGFVGKISGLPFDIRHITFSTGNLALGFAGVDFQSDLSLVFGCLSGILIIGICNFLFSFLPALQVAARSRGIVLKDYPHLLIAVLKYFRKKPHHFIFPPGGKKDESTPAQV